jgi:eukaryotic-like serine/threonine-protein kinase
MVSEVASMIPERWDEIKDKLQAALELEPSQRSSYLDHAGVNPEMRQELESLLVAHDKAGTDFLSPTRAVSEMGVRGGLTISLGKRIGPYQIVEEIGAGGMGEVYRAFRIDDEYQKQVAIKLVRAGQDSGFVLSRFKNERQILANLDHPNIARLFDGGTTEEGVPYFVMELIEGEPIDEYCNHRKVPVPERLRLFSQVCSAVQYAHQRLIIHRDIKPGNILVTSAGVAKLLDFGIAKILDTDAVTGRFAPTLTVFRLMTPGYASPEQVKGEPITTASDVYSLGMVLYELLTGRHPYRPAGSTPRQVERAACEAEPEKPSFAVRRTVQDSDTPRNGPVTPETGPITAGFGDSVEKLSKKLRGDLDNIILMALRKEPQRRYASVQQFAEDIRRHLENLPVLARKDTAGYRAAKFITRHKAGVAAAVIVLATLVVGMAVTLHEARIARLQETRAQRRFNDVRALANSLLFDVHDSIQDLPGSTPARKLLVERALLYLDSLSRDAASDASLQRELATAYEKVGTVQGNPFGANLGDIQGAVNSYRKAIAMREPLAKANPTNVDDQVVLARSQRLFAATFSNQADAQNEAINMGNELRALATAERAYQLAPSNAAVLRELQSNYDILVTFKYSSGDYQGAWAYLQKEQPIIESQLHAAPEDRVVRIGLGKSEVKSGQQLANLGFAAEGVGHSRHGIQIFETLSAGGTDANARRLVSWAQDRLGDVLLMGRHVNGALSAYKKEADVLQSLLAADPNNAVIQNDLALALAKQGSSLAIAGDAEKGLALLQRAAAMLRWQIARDPAYGEPQWSLAWDLIWTGEALARSGNADGALESYRQALQMWQANPNLFVQTLVAGIHGKIASVYAVMGKESEAAQEAQRALKITEAVITTHDYMLDARYVAADAYSILGDLAQMAAAKTSFPEQELQRLNEARDRYQRSLNMWQTIHNPGTRTPAGFACGNPKMAAHQIAKCDAALARLRR